MDPREVQEHITGFWSFAAPEYEAHEGNVPPRAGPERDAWVSTIRDLLPAPPADVLDIGTGTGFVALIAAARGHRVTGIDLAQPMLELARAEAARLDLDVRFEAGDAVEPPLPAGSFDAIISRHLMWTLREPERAIANWRRLLRPGGRVVVIDGFWFEPAPGPGPEPEPEPGPFERYYTRETRAAIPGMNMQDSAPAVAMFERAGFLGVTVSELAAIQAAEATSTEHRRYALVAELADGNGGTR